MAEDWRHFVFVLAGAVYCQYDPTKNAREINLTSLRLAIVFGEAVCDYKQLS